MSLYLDFKITIGFLFRIHIDNIESEDGFWIRICFIINRDVMELNGVKAPSN